MRVDLPSSTLPAVVEAQQIVFFALAQEALDVSQGRRKGRNVRQH